MSLANPCSTKHSAEGRIFLAILAIFLVMTGLLIAGCGGSDQPLAPIAITNEPIEIPELTPAQEAAAVKIAKKDPVVGEILQGRQATVRSVGEWTRPNQELLGAVVDFSLGKPGSFSELDRPAIANTDQLYGEEIEGGYEGERGDVEPDVKPEIETLSFSATNLKRISVLVYLEGKTVAEILPMGGDVEFGDG